MLLLFLIATWGTQFHVIKFSVSQIPGSVSVFYRFLIVLILTQVLLFFSDIKSSSEGKAARIVLALARALSFLLIYQAQKSLLSSQTMTLMLLHPVIIFLLEPFLIGSARYNGKIFAALALGLAGTWMFVASFPVLTPEIQGAVGITVIAAVFEGLTKIYSKKTVQRDNPLIVLRDLSLVSCAVSLIVMKGQGTGFYFKEILSEAWLPVCYLGLFCSFLSNLAFFKVIKEMPISQYSFMAYVYVLVAFVIDLGMGLQKLSLLNALGVCCLFAGSFLLRHKPPTAPRLIT